MMTFEQNAILNKPAFSFSEVPQQKRIRWFVRRGATTKFDRGFRSKSDASNWINSFGSRLDWRAGFAFRLRGDDMDMHIVDRKGNRADAVRSVSACKINVVSSRACERGTKSCIIKHD